MDKRIATAVVGLGYAGAKLHVPLIGRCAALRLAAVVSGDADKRAAAMRLGADHAYEKFSQLLSDQTVELVVLATPNSTHGPLAMAALEAGKHVVVDKPIATSFAEATAMLAAAQRRGKLLSVFHNRRWDGDFLTLGQVMEANTLGPVRWLETAWQKYGLPRTWRRSADAGGGRLLDLGSHLLDQILLLFTEPVQSVYCRMHRDYPAHDIESHCQVTIGFVGGRTAICDTTSATHITKPRYYAIGQAATLIKYGIDPQEAALLAGDLDAVHYDPRDDARVEDGNTERIIPTLPGRWDQYYHQVAQAMLHHAPNPTPAEQMLRLMQVLDAARQSAQSGQCIQLATSPQ